MDWLRIAAFGLLILHHIGMVFAPWDWVVHARERYLALVPFMSLLMPWRLALLFAVSGYATRHFLARVSDPGAFARARARQLLIPLAFAVVTIVPLEMWVRVVNAGYPHSYWHFIAFDYWRVGTFYGVRFPSWQHMWFVAYLACYSLLLAAILSRNGAAFYGWLDRLQVRLSAGHQLLLLPILVLAAIRLSLMFVVPEQTGLFSDWVGHSLYGAAFLFGFAIAGRSDLWPVVYRQSRLALLCAACAGAVIVTVDMLWPGSTMPPHVVAIVERFCRAMMAWSMILLLFRYAHQFCNRDHRWRRPLAEAIFPFYIIHHTSIVVLAWQILPLNLGPVISYILILIGTVATCGLVYGIGRKISWFRPLIGLGTKRMRPATSATTPIASTTT